MNCDIRDNASFIDEFGTIEDKVVSHRGDLQGRFAKSDKTTCKIVIENDGLLPLIRLLGRPNNICKRAPE
jgi:hypothetical protein